MYTVPTAASVLPIASTAAEYTPVWPTYRRISSHRSTKSGQMSHIRRGKITHHELMFPHTEHISDFIRYALHAHLRVLIVRRDFKGGIMWRSSASNCFSTPPLKKNVRVRISPFLPMYDVSCPIGTEGGTTKEDRE
jgi:hypothetical protein